MRLLISIAQKSSHLGNMLGNMFVRPGGIPAANHSLPGLKTNGFDQPSVPYELGRFVDSGWGTKAVVDFMNNNVKRVTAVRIDPTATAMLVLRGELVGSFGWDGDHLGCSVEARVRPADGDAVEVARKQADHGNHLIWVYGDYADPMRRLGELINMRGEVFG